MLLYKKLLLMTFGTTLVIIIYGIYIKTFVSTCLLPVYKLGLLLYEIYNEFYITWPTLVTQ